MIAHDLLRPSVLKDLCVRAGMRPEKSSGQNFLINRATLDRIVAAVDPQPGDLILEIGAGFGVLTLALAEQLKNGGRIFAIERDRRIVPILHEFVGPHGNVDVVEGDVLRLFKFILRESSDRRISPMPDARASSTSTRVGEMLRRSAPQHKLKIAANLPYGITSDFLRLLFDHVADGTLPVPDRVVLLLQREVVDRLTADSKRASDRGAVGVLTMLARLHCTPRRIARVPPGHFWPPPKVESAVVVLDGWRSPARLQELLGTVSRDEVIRLIHAAFARRRGQISGILQRYTKRSREDVERILSALHIAPVARPETLTIEQWIGLARMLAGG
ncbi:ribosomal RNA small subunit methyltransferase A [Candidatus Uhrbacteria bacterium]|nr:ribosomal RNA small subunit methyltransferase A [Candidatus Uhrbacteria bacterium]